jgi:hypothetical protein
MRLRAQMARPSVHWSSSVTNGLVRVMTNRMYGALVASVGVVALMLAANEASARSGAGFRGGFTPTHSFAHSAAAHAFRHGRRNNTGIVWPGVEDYGYGSSTGEPVAGVTQPASGDIHYTQTYDVPWDWAHRFPPAVAPSDKPYVPGCPAENVTVPGHDGREQTVSIMRCY